MARSKHPEETVNLILDVSFRLFLEKGYQYTSIQDIIDNLGGLSKGAIYHHFKSKEDILIAVTDRLTADSNRLLSQIRDLDDVSGKEKLRMAFKSSLNRPVQDKLFTIAPNMNNNPQLFFSMLEDTIKFAAPEYIRPIIQQGIDDGSITTEYPEQLAELILLLANVWLNPMTSGSSVDEIRGKVMLFRQMMKGFGLDIIDDEIVDRLLTLTDIYQEHR